MSCGSPAARSGLGIPPVIDLGDDGDHERCMGWRDDVRAAWAASRPMVGRALDTIPGGSVFVAIL